MKQQKNESRLGTMPVGRLILGMSLPMMLSFFIQALYNIVDSIFVAQISENALTAVTLAFPMQQAVHAISVGIGVGVSASVPRALGQKDARKAARYAGTAVVIDFLAMLLFAVLGMTAAHAVYAAQTDVSEIVDMGTTYLSICWIVCAGDFYGQIFEKLLISTGRSTMAMAAQAAGAVFNIVFDPLLIFGVGPFPKMGVAGAAIATVLGQVLGAVIALILNIRFNASLHVVRSDLRLRIAEVKDIFAVGIPSMITIGLGSATTFFINQILLSYSTTAAAVYGIWMKLQNFSFMPIFGMNNGIVPILSYNHACGKLDRVKRTIRLSVTAIAVYTGILFLVLELIPGAILYLFNASDNMLSIGMTALRTCILSLPLGGTCIILTTTMQALRHSRYTLIVNILRQFVYIVSCFALLSFLTHSLKVVWIAVPAAEALSLVTAAVFERRMWRDLFGHPDQETA